MQSLYTLCTTVQCDKTRHSLAIPVSSRIIMPRLMQYYTCPLLSCGITGYGSTLYRDCIGCFPILPYYTPVFTFTAFPLHT